MNGGGSRGSARTGRWFFTVLAIVLAAAIIYGARQLIVDRVPARINAMPSDKSSRAAAAIMAWAGLSTAGTAQPLPSPPPTVLGMNVPEIRYYGSAVPFANLVIGSDWNDTRWKPLPDDHQNANGDILSLPADGTALRFLSIPITGPDGIEVRCTFAGSGEISLAGGGQTLSSQPGNLRFRIVGRRDQQSAPWLVLTGVDPRRPFRDLDCRDVRLDRGVRFRPEFLQSLRGYRVIRFMDWQNANANEAVPWQARHLPSGNRIDRDGVSVEDMLALARELGADPWFVMPWNADDDYIVRFARMVRAQLPADRSVYVEVGNEVWNAGFRVSRQAVKEGVARRLGNDDRAAGVSRYAERTIEIMRHWETVFAGRRGLVRVLSTQHVLPLTAETALTYRNTASHIDALATAPYFGGTKGGTDNTRESSLQTLESELKATLDSAIDNKRVAVRYGKRYIAYEGGQGLVLPAQVPLLNALQHDPAMYDLYRRYLTGWRLRVGDVLCLLTSVSRPGPYGAWGLAAWEDETLAEAPKLRAVREAMRDGGVQSPSTTTGKIPRTTQE